MGLAELQEYKCPCCGGAIAFDSGIQKMKCPFCDNPDTKVIDSRPTEDGHAMTVS